MKLMERLSGNKDKIQLTFRRGNKLSNRFPEKLVHEKLEYYHQSGGSNQKPVDEMRNESPWERKQ